MKQLLKRSTALLLAVIFALMMPMTALATTTATEDSSTVVVKSDSTANINVNIDNGDNSNAYLSINSYGNVYLYLYQVITITYDEDKNSFNYEFTDDFANFIKDYKEGEEFTIDDYCELDDEDLNLLLGSFISYCKSNSVWSDDTITTDYDGKATFENVALGQYVIVADCGEYSNNTINKIYQTVTAEVVPFTQEGQYVIYENYDVVMKSTELSIIKDIVNRDVYTTDRNSPTINIGDVVTFSLEFNIPQFPEGSTDRTFYVTDYARNFNRVDDSFKVTADGQTLTKGTDYTIEFSGSYFTINFNYDKVKDYSSFYITYDEVLSEYADIAYGENLNSASLYYSSSNGSGYVQTYPIFMYTFGLVIHKYDDVTKSALEGAEFAIYDNEDCEGDPIGTITTDSDGYGGYKGLKYGTYYVVETKAPTGYKRDSTPHEVIVGYDYVTKGYGLNATDIEYTSDINESLYGVQARDNYGNLLWIDPNDTTQVYTSESSNYVPAYVKSLNYELSENDYDYYVVLEFPNGEGITLPTTGGIGVVPFIIAGSALMVGAVIVLVTRKRMDGEDEEIL